MPETPIRDLLMTAIRSKRLIKLQYEGHTRTLAPHVYGVDASGNELLSGYVVWGGSDADGEQGWKTFKVANIVAPKLTTKKFGPRPEYQQGDAAMREIYCQV